MKFTDKDKQFLLEKIYGGLKKTFEEDLPQIEEAADVTKYSLIKYEEDNWRGKYDEKRISRTEAIRILGRKGWLSGLSRAAFHMSAVRNLDDMRSQVYFDSRNLFK